LSGPVKVIAPALAKTKRATARKPRLIAITSTYIASGAATSGLLLNSPGKELLPMQIQSKIKPRSVKVEMVITKADGRVIDLGVVDYFHKNPFINLFMTVKLALAARKRLKAEA
jgi:hypothetical protein